MRRCSASLIIYVIANRYDNPRQHIQKQRHYFADKDPSGQSYGFSSSHIWMWELDYKESWVPKNWCSWNVVLEKTLQSPLDSKESNQSFLKEISPEYSLEGLTLKMKLQYLGHLIQSQLIGNATMLGKTEGRRRRGGQRTRRLDGVTDQWTWVWANPGRQWACCSPWVAERWTWISDSHRRPFLRTRVSAGAATPTHYLKVRKDPLSFHHFFQNSTVA